MDCLFCKIAAGEIPSKKVYEDDQILAFHDIAPQAPVHVLIIPKNHIPGADAVTSEDAPVIAHIFACIPKIAELSGLKNGFRLISNAGPDGCQSVRHLHFHLLGGKQLPETMA